jgi:hypothetical protein
MEKEGLTQQRILKKKAKVQRRTRKMMVKEWKRFF